MRLNQLKRGVFLSYFQKGINILIKNCSRKDAILNIKKFQEKLKEFAADNSALNGFEDGSLYISLITKDAAQVCNEFWSENDMDTYKAKMRVKSILAPVVEFFYKIFQEWNQYKTYR